MDLPWWGRVLVALWLTAGVGGFIVFLRRFESAYAVWYFLFGEEGFRGPYRTFSRSLPLVAVLLFCLFLGPLGLLIEVLSQRQTKREIRRKEQLREQRRQRRAAAATARAAGAEASNDR